jgi:hypothetical protein
MRYILATALLMTVGMTSSAKADCGPAVQNWQNGSQTTCPYDSNGGEVSVTPAAAPASIPEVEVDNCREKESYEGYKERKSYRANRSSKRSNGNRGGES